MTATYLVPVLPTSGTFVYSLAVLPTNGTIIESAGATTLIATTSDTFTMLQPADGSQATLQKDGTAVTKTQFTATRGTPIAAEILPSGGYEIAWVNTDPDGNGDGAPPIYTIWYTDATGNYVSTQLGNATASSIPLQEFESSFHQDLNGDGTIGLAGTVIESVGTTTLIKVGTSYVLEGSDGTGPVLKIGGIPADDTSPLLPGKPVAAEIRSSGNYLVAFSDGAGDFTIWNVDANGNYAGMMGDFNMPGTSLALETLEPLFHQDLNGDGTIGPPGSVIEANGATTLLRVGNTYVLEDSSGTGTVLQLNASPVTVGQFGAGVVPIAAEALSGGGYEVAWENTNNGLYIVWDTDANGNYLNSPTGAVSATNFALEQLEPSFHQDLNGDGTIGIVGTTIEAFGAITLERVGNNYLLAGSGGTGPALQLNNGFVTVGQFGAGIVPIAAEALSGGGYEVAWENTNNGLYIVWDTDANGNYLNSPTGAVSATSFALEQLEPSFHQDLNGDGRLSTVVDLGTSGGDTLDLTSQTAIATVNQEGNTAQASAGLTAPSLSFIGTPDVLTLGSAGATVEYALAPSSGIETIANFTLGRDELNIDLMSAASSVLQAFDTTVSGNAAIAITSSADRTHGIVLLNTTGQTALNLLTNHTTFSGGHALIG